MRSKAPELAFSARHASIDIRLSLQAVTRFTTRNTTANLPQQSASRAKRMLRGGPLGKRATVQTCPEQHCDRAAKLLRVRIVSARKDEPDCSPPAAPTPSARQRSPRSFLLTRGHSRPRKLRRPRPSSTCCGYGIARAVRWSSTRAGAVAAPRARPRSGKRLSGYLR